MHRPTYSEIAGLNRRGEARMGVLRTIRIAVCVISGVAAEEAVKAETAKPELPKSWVNLHQAGFEAFGAGRFEEALADFSASLSLARGSTERAASLNDIGSALAALRRGSEAIENFTEALRTWREIDRTGMHAVESAISVAVAQRALDRHMAAEQTLREALNAHPRDSAAIAALSNSLGDLLREQDRLKEARHHFEHALELSRDPGRRRADALIGLADVERAESQVLSSITHWNEALGIARQRSDHTLEGLALQGLGKTFLDSGDLARAQPTLKRALAIFDADPALRDQSASALACLGVVYRDQKKYAMAEDALTRALNMQGGFEHAARPQAAMIMQYLASVFLARHRTDLATDYADRALHVMEAKFPAGSPPVAGALATKAFIEQRAGNPSASARHYSQAIEIMRRNGVADSELGADFMMEYAGVLRRLHRGSDARALESEAKGFRQSVR